MHEHEHEHEPFVRYTIWASATGLVLTLVSVSLVPGWVGATLGVAQGLAWTLLLIVRHPSRWITNIVLFGLAAGFVELAADLWLVHGVEVLVYPPHGPFLLASPAYMPFAWLGMLTGGMAVGVAARRRLSRAAATFVVSLASGLYIPLYELLALHAEWWHYDHPTLILGAVPLSIVLGEVLLALPLVLVTERLGRLGPLAACGLGVAEGAWILVSYRVAWALVG